MYCKETHSAVVPSARQLTDENKVLTFINDELPLAVFADSIEVDGRPNQVAFSNDLASSVEDFIENANENVVEVVTDEQEALIENFQAALAKIQFNTQNIIRPAIDTMVTNYNQMDNTLSSPDISVTRFDYNEIHSDPRLTAHVSTRYVNLKPNPEYRTFILNPKPASEIIQLVSNGNPHLDQTQVQQWLLSIPNSGQAIEQVWDTLFGNSRVLVPANISFINGINFPFGVDQLALAYMICGHLMDNPENVIGESDVSIEVWELTLRYLHEMLGFYLNRAYVRRLTEKEAGLLILDADARNPVATRKVHVVLNGDVATPFLERGGDIQAILGAVVSSDDRYIEQITQNNELYIKRWLEVYPLIKQAALDYASANIRNNIIKAFRNGVIETDLKDRYIENFETSLQYATSQLAYADYKNPFIAFAKLICHTYFTDSVYWDYLNSIDEYSHAYPEASARELATQSLITLAVVWAAKQIRVETFKPDVDEEATRKFEEPTEEEAEVEIEEGVMGQGPLVEETIETETPLA